MYCGTGYLRISIFHKKMSQIEILDEIKKNLTTFFDELIDQFQEEGELIRIRISIKDVYPIVNILNTMIHDLLPYKERIKAKDDTLITDPLIFKSISPDRVRLFRKIWRSNKLDKTDRETIWKWIESWIYLIEKYQKTIFPI